MIAETRSSESQCAPRTGYECLVAVAAAALAGRDLLLVHGEQERMEWLGRPVQTTHAEAPTTQPAPRQSQPSVDSERPDDLLQRIETSSARIGILTSGSTGKPQCVWHSLPSLLRAISRAGHHRDDVWGFAYHPAHFAGLQVLLQALVHQNQLVELFHLDSAEIHQAIDDHRVTHISATPTYFRRLLGAPGTHPSVRRVTTGGERSSPELRRELAGVFPQAKILNIYASTEAGTLLVAEGEAFRVPDRYADRIRVLDGQLMIHRSLLGEIDGGDRSPVSDGEFFATGDLVQVVTERPLTVSFQSRANEIINVGGYKVAPQDVEAKLLEMDEIAEAIVYGKPNSVTGYVVACDIVLRPSATIDATVIRHRLSSALERHQLPRLIRFVPIIDQTVTGKKTRGMAAP